MANKRRLKTHLVTGLFLASGLAVSALTGCSMCCGPHDFDYPTFGGKHERVDRQWGRVGSPFSDPNVVVGPSADSNLKPHEEFRDPNSGLLEEPGLPDDQSDILPDPNQTPSIDDEPTAARPWPTRPLRGQWR